MTSGLEGCMVRNSSCTFSLNRSVSRKFSSYPSCYVYNPSFICSADFENVLTSQLVNIYAIASGENEGHCRITGRLFCLLMVYGISSRPQVSLFCAALCKIVSLQYLSRSSLHRLTGLPCHLLLVTFSLVNIVTSLDDNRDIKSI